MHGVTRGEVILDALDYQLNELRVAGDEHRDEQITLQRREMYMIPLELVTHDLFLGVLVR